MDAAAGVEQSYAEVAAGVKAALAAYTHALDDGRTEDVVDTFCPDATVDIPGLGAHEGHEALRAAYARWVPRRPQRHVVVNTHVTTGPDGAAYAVSDVLFLLKGPDGWAVQVVGRYSDVLHLHGERWRFHRRTAEFVP
jgi:ketosteroid isomerase-like protein